MSLLIAFMLIYHFELSWWWYLIAVAAFAAKQGLDDSRHTDIKNRLYRLEHKIPPP